MGKKRRGGGGGGGGGGGRRDWRRRGKAKKKQKLERAAATAAATATRTAAGEATTPTRTVAESLSTKDSNDKNWQDALPWEAVDRVVATTEEELMIEQANDEDGDEIGLGVGEEGAMGWVGDEDDGETTFFGGLEVLDGREFGIMESDGDGGFRIVRKSNTSGQLPMNSTRNVVDKRTTSKEAAEEMKKKGQGKELEKKEKKKKKKKRAPQKSNGDIGEDDRTPDDGKRAKHSSPHYISPQMLGTSPWRSLHLSSTLHRAVLSRGLQRPTPIQQAVVPAAIAGMIDNISFCPPSFSFFSHYDAT